MKKITLIILIMLSVTGLQAQNIFFPTKVGSVQTYATLNNKGKVEGYVRQTITDIKGGGNDKNNLRITSRKTNRKKWCN